MSIDSAIVHRVINHLNTCGGMDILIANGEVYQITAKRLEHAEIREAIQAMKPDQEKPMTTEQSEMLDSIHRLARTINAEMDIYVSCSERMHEVGAENGITIMICTGHNGETYTFDRIEGNGWHGSRGTIPQARDELAEWLADARKRKEVA